MSEDVSLELFGIMSSGNVTVRLGICSLIGLFCEVLSVCGCCVVFCVMLSMWCMYAVDVLR